MAILDWKYCLIEKKMSEKQTNHTHKIEFADVVGENLPLCNYEYTQYQ